MEKTAAILVDAGYVWMQIAKSVGKHSRKDTVLTGQGVPLIEALVEEAEGDDLTVLRTYWYDGAIDRIPNVQHGAVGRATKVKLRLGLLTAGGQKGVDRLIQKDILALAQNKAVTDIIVLTGDQDMEEEMDAAGEHGATIHLWTIRDPAGENSVAGRLLHIVDEWKVFEPDWAETFVWDGGSVGNGDAARAQTALGTDAALKTLRAELRGDGQPPEYSPDSSTLTTPNQLHDTGRAAYDSLREKYGSHWSSIREEIAGTTFVGLSGETRRSIPGRYDAELIDTVEAIVGGKVSDMIARASARAGFWSRLDEDSS